MIISNNNKYKRMTTNTVYRFKFSEEIVTMLTAFAKLHANDDRKTYREAWRSWCDANSEVLDIEVRRMHNNGYEGDVLDKMYKAGRYYFREKKTGKKQDAKQRRRYISMSSDMIKAMDDHIEDVMNLDEFTPANGYDWFCTTHLELLREEVTLLQEEGALTAEDLVAKVKKTYKNRYFLKRA